MTYEENLRELGLRPNEARVYLTLLRIGEAQAGIVAKEARLERTSTYNALHRLVRKGLVSYTVSANKKVFTAAEPESFTSYFMEKMERSKILIQDLSALKRLEHAHDKLVKFSGYSGVKTVLNDVLKTCKPGEEYYMFGSEGQLGERLPTYAKIFVKQKDAKKLKAKILVRRGQGKRPMSRLTQYRIVPHDVISPTVVSVYGDKICLIMWTENPEAVLIDDKATAETFRSYFEFMWEHAEKP